MTTANSCWTPLVSIVDFNHARGPEIEAWFGAEDGADPAEEFDWPNIPFMALADGAHLALEDFSYFTLLKPATDTSEATSLFGISCTRQLAATELINKPADVTRSTVQKAVVVLADSPHLFGMLRERLSVVTSAWFAQKDFTETEILKRFQESLREEADRGRLEEEKERDQYLGMSLRQLIREFKWQTLVLFKCCLLQPKMLFFGTRCERLCMMQFSLVSLIPGLIRNLRDSADPSLDSYERNLRKPTSLKSSDRNSLLSYMGLPLQIFGKGSLFGPYTPLQQLDKLAEFGTKSYIVGSTNSLLLMQKDRYSDILINLDEGTINISSVSLRSVLNLSTADRRWIDFITQSVNDTWDEQNPERPNTMGYVGSEEFIRLQFEEYLLSLLSSVKCHNYMQSNVNNPAAHMPHVEGDPTNDFGAEWIEAWTRTENYRLWNSNTDSHLFDIVEPKHPCAGGLTIDDVQRRLAQQVKELGLDQRFAVGKEVVGRNLGMAKDRASVVFNRLYADVEALREANRRKAEEDANSAAAPGGTGPTGTSPTSAPTSATSDTFTKPDLTKAQAAAATASSKASSYIGSWASWAGEKKKGWAAAKSASTSKRNSAEINHSDFPPDFQPRDITPKVSLSTSRPASVAPSTSRFQMQPRSVSDVWSRHGRADGYARPESKDSYKESLFDAEHSETDEDEKKIYGREGKSFLKQYERQSEDSTFSNDGFQVVNLDTPASAEASGAVTPTPTTAAAAPQPIPAADIVAAIERPAVEKTDSAATIKPTITPFRTKIPPAVEPSPVQSTFPAAVQHPAPALEKVENAPSPSNVVSASPPAPAPAAVPVAEVAPSKEVEPSPLVTTPTPGPVPATQGVPLAEQQAKRFTHTKTTSSAVSAMRARFEAAQKDLGK